MTENDDFRNRSGQHFPRGNESSFGLADDLYFLVEVKKKEYGETVRFEALEEVAKLQQGQSD